MKDAILRANSTTASGEFMNKIADPISRIAHIIVNSLEMRSSSDSEMFFLNGLYRSSIVDDEREDIEPARVDRAAANKPAIIRPETPGGSDSIINLGKISAAFTNPIEERSYVP